MAKFDETGGNRKESWHVMQNRALPWRPASNWAENERPAALWPWLSHRDSLTEKLRSAVGAAFHVEVLREFAAPLAADDAQLLHTLPGTAAQVREVYLCGQVPCVYARTLATAEAAYWLDRLDAQPLGDRVFAASDTERLPIQIAALDASQELYQAALRRAGPKPAELWTRRSVLVAENRRLLIYECFLLEHPH